MSKTTKSNFDTMSQTAFLTRIMEMAQDSKNLVKTKKLVYVAAPWFDDRASILLDLVKSIEKNVSSTSKYKLYYPKDNTNVDSPEHTFNDNVAAITASDMVIALVSRKDVGTAWEIGYANALGKKVYLVGFDETCFKSKTNLMLAFSGKCFTMDKLAEFLVDGYLDSADYLRVRESWEGLE